MSRATPRYPFWVRHSCGHRRINHTYAEGEENVARIKAFLKTIRCLRCRQRDKANARPCEQGETP